jgi:transcriptional regulator with XRE-family HTH domain
MSATLGGLIKDLRLQKNISQLEIAFALGWKEPSRLSRIEQGKNTSPPRFLIENIMNAMKLTEEERSQLLVAGNYLPSKDEIEEAKKKIKPIVDGWLFPASAMDYTWRVIHTNQQLLNLYDISKAWGEQIEEETPWIHEIVFHPDFLPNKTKSDEEFKVRKEFLRTMLIQFQNAQKTRTREKWYLDHIKDMMNNSLFREIWLKSQHNRGLNVVNYAEKTVTKKLGKERVELNFYFFMQPLFGDPRFFIEFYLPSDLATFQYFDK